MKIRMKIFTWLEGVLISAIIFAPAQQVLAIPPGYCNFVNPVVIVNMTGVRTTVNVNVEFGGANSGNGAGSYVDEITSNFSSPTTLTGIVAVPYTITGGITSGIYQIYVNGLTGVGPGDPVGEFFICLGSLDIRNTGSGDAADIKADGSDGPVVLPAGDTRTDLTWTCSGSTNRSYRVTGAGLNLTGNSSNGFRNNVDVGVGATFHLTCYDQTNQTGNTETDTVTVGITLDFSSSNPSTCIQIRNPSTGIWTGCGFPQTIAYGTSTLIRWNSTDVSNCTITSSPADGSAATPRNELINPGYPSGISTGALYQTHTYTSTCTAIDQEGNTQTVSNAVTITVSPPPPNFTYSCTPATQIINQGDAAAYTISIIHQNGLTDPVTVSLLANPVPNTTPTIANSPVSPGGPAAILTMQTQAITTAGLYTLTIQMQSSAPSSITKTCDVNLQVNALPAYAYTVTPASLTFTATENGPQPPQQQFTLQNTGTNKIDDLTFSKTQAWLNLGSVSMSLDVGETKTLDIQITTTALAPSPPDYTDIVSFNSAQAGNQSRPITYTVNPAGGSPPIADIKANGSDTPAAITYNTAAVLSWTSTDATTCDVTSLPIGYTNSGISNLGTTTGSLTTTTAYTLSCSNLNGTTTDSVTVTVNPPTYNLSTSDKDLISVNPNPLPNNNNPASSCSAQTDPITIVTYFKAGDRVRFSVNICNTGSTDAANVSVTDTLVNLTLVPGSFNDSGCSGGISPAQPTQVGNTISFTLKNDVNNGSTCSVKFDATVTPPINAQPNTLYRFQNRADISVNSILAKTLKTPLYLFRTGSTAPQRNEVAP